MKRYRYEIHLASGAVVHGLSAYTRQSPEAIALVFLRLKSGDINSVVIYPN